MHFLSLPKSMATIGWLKTTDTYSLNSSGSKKSGIKASAGPCLSEGSMGKSVACLSLGVWWLPAPLGIPWLVSASLQTVSIVTWHHLLCACVHISFGRTPFIGIGSHHDNT